MHEKNRIIERLAVPENKIDVIYNGINRRFRKYKDVLTIEKFLKKYKLPNQYILFIGNNSHRKNPERVLEAYIQYHNRKGSDAQALVTPGLSQEFVDHYLKATNQSHIKKSIHTPGYIESDELPILYSCSTLFLFPSLSEGFGMPVLEAMACGVAVITSNTSSLPEIAGDAAKLINPTDTGALTQAIEELMEDPALMADLSARGLKQAEKFLWSRVAEKTMEIYERVYFNSSRNHPKDVHDVLST